MSSLSSCHWIEQLSFQEQHCSKQMRGHLQAQAQKEEWVLRPGCQGPLGPRQDWHCTTNSSFSHTHLSPFRSRKPGQAPCTSPSPLLSPHTYTKARRRVCWALLALGVQASKRQKVQLRLSWKGSRRLRQEQGCIRHRGIRCFSAQGLDTILHKGNSNKTSKLNSFVPDTMVAVETTARAASRANVTAGHGGGKKGRREASPVLSSTAA